MTQTSQPVPDNPGGTRAQHIAMGALALGLLLLGAFTLRNFLSALAWASIFAIALWPLYVRAIARFGTGRHNILLPLAFTLGIALIFVAPVGLVGLQLAKQAQSASDWVHDAQANGITEPAIIQSLPFDHTQIDDWWQTTLGNPGGAQKLVRQTAGGHVAHVSRLVGEALLHRLSDFIFTLVTLFFLFREGVTLTRQLRHGALRAFGLTGERIGQQIIASIHGTVNGLVLVGLAEGLVLGVVYWIAGVPQATVFGMITAIAAMVPFAATAVFAVIALLLLAQGAIGWAIGVVCVGVLVTFVADHFIRPVLIGGTTKLPFLWVLLGILGGIEAWGIIGLFLGPAIMAALILLWREWVGEGPV
ncbi:AI-2E family transporter [Acidisoma cellulosilytica]|uniref:AI-2E family transporter n=1 Tax=Acidisoma cellulosilyticum TaxID=2802395 RepID=A0A963YYL4_9PROT|nr:AI-2E family transporter [Acidisoma cellulosilyticum]MCB8878645.1 AI-2E family transporter [Acidisoma cellulosilyticum]